MADMQLVKCENLVMSYEGVVAVHDVSFSVDEGDYLCIVGENGSGKSTLIKGILGLKPIASGKIDFFGLKQTEIGYLPQQTAPQKDFPATVWEVVLSGCLNRCGMSPFYGKKNRERAMNAIKQLKIEHLVKKCYRDLSGGQQQRVLLARALCATEKLLLLDEPVTGLDPMVTAEMYEVISDLNRKNGVTVIMISHDINSAVRYGNKILHMAAGSTFFGKTEEYLSTDIYRKLTGGGANA